MSLQYLSRRFGTLGISDGSINVHGVKFAVTKQFEDSFFRMMNMSRRGSTNDHFLFADLYNATIWSSAKREVTLYVDLGSGLLLSIFDASINPIPVSMSREFLKLLAEHHLTIEDLVQDVSAMEFSLLRSAEFSAYDGVGGQFRSGLRVRVPHDGSPNAKIDLVLERQLCTNRSIIRKADVTTKCDMRKQTAIEFLRGLVSNIVFMLRTTEDTTTRWIQARFAVIKHTMASLQEILQCADKLRKNMRNRTIQAMEPLALDLVLDTYQIASADEYSYQWRKTATTPVTRLTLLNLLSEAAHHASSDARYALQTTSGEVLSSTGDLENHAPPKEWNVLDRSQESHLISSDST